MNMQLQLYHFACPECTPTRDREGVFGALPIDDTIDLDTLRVAEGANACDKCGTIMDWRLRLTQEEVEGLRQLLSVEIAHIYDGAPELPHAAYDIAAALDRILTKLGGYVHVDG